MAHLVPAWLVGKQSECMKVARKMWKAYARGVPFSELFAEFLDLDEDGSYIFIGEAARSSTGERMMRPYVIGTAAIMGEVPYDLERRLARELIREPWGVLTMFSGTAGRHLAKELEPWEFIRGLRQHLPWLTSYGPRYRHIEQLGPERFSLRYAVPALWMLNRAGISDDELNRLPLEQLLETALARQPS